MKQFLIIGYAKEQKEYQWQAIKEGLIIEAEDLVSAYQKVELHFKTMFSNWLIVVKELTKE